MKLITTYNAPPIRCRDYDWICVDEDSYDGAPDAGLQIVGAGRTEEEAIKDFYEQLNNM